MPSILVTDPPKKQALFSNLKIIVSHPATNRCDFCIDNRRLCDNSLKRTPDTGRPIMFAYIDFGKPSYYSARSTLLLVMLCFLAYLVSPFNPMQRKERQGLLLVYPAIIFIYWVMFQVRLMSLDPHVHHHLGLTGVYSWMTNSFICLSFGAAFSLAIFFTPGIGRRCYGGLFLALYLLLIFGGSLIRPPVMST